MIKSTNLFVIGLVTLAFSANAGSGGISSIAGATLPEQMLQEATAVNQLSEAVTQTAQQLQLITNQVKNLTSLPQQLWPNVSGQLSQLVNLMGTAQGLTYSTLNTLDSAQSIYGLPSAPLQQYSSHLQQWTTNLLSQTSSLLNQYGLESQQFANEQLSLSSIQNLSQNAVGRMQVLQAGNQISGLLVNQMQLLRQDIMGGNQVMMNALATQANSHQQDRNNGEAWINSNNHYNSNY
ncbi:MAG: P-type conjugative transfer protein TrbJ [Betaproteobacteria bacterium]|nr:P-type conjugative transfer protein TrbJ [Betaproteobacteria bacterium]MDE2056445.1 P-type conjugative transfer protein TrbJ [Betaproteobacteria bacterium]